MFNPDSPQGLAISNLFVLTLLIAAGIFLLVAGLVVYASICYRRKPGQGEPYQNFGIPKLEVGWTVAPAVLLLGLFGVTFVGMGNADPAVEKDRAPDIIVTGYQWWWGVSYPQAGVISANEIHMPAGKRMLVRLIGGDVIHDLWIPRLGRKMDMVPGHPNEMYMQADTPGVYIGACAEYCGVQHSKMLIRAVVQTPTEYDAWLKTHSAPAPAHPDAAFALRGQQLFQQKTCISCHAINGTAANAQIGPNLTHVASRQTLAAGVLQNTPENMAAWIKNPQQIKPGSYMPNLRLTDDEIKALVAYMETLK